MTEKQNDAEWFRSKRIEASKRLEGLTALYAGYCFERNEAFRRAKFEEMKSVFRDLQYLEGDIK